MKANKDISENLVVYRVQNFCSLLLVVLLVEMNSL